MAPGDTTVGSTPDTANAEARKDGSLAYKITPICLVPFFAQRRCLEEFASLLFTFSFTHGFDRFGIERPATEAIGTRVSRGPVSYGHGQ